MEGGVRRVVGKPHEPRIVLLLDPFDCSIREDFGDVPGICGCHAIFSELPVVVVTYTGAEDPGEVVNAERLRVEA